MHSFIIFSNEHKLEILVVVHCELWWELPETRDGQTFVFIGVCILNLVWYRRFIPLCKSMAFYLFMNISNYQWKVLSIGFYYFGNELLVTSEVTRVFNILGDTKNVICHECFQTQEVDIGVSKITWFKQYMKD